MENQRDLSEFEQQNHRGNQQQQEGQFKMGSLLLFLVLGTAIVVGAYWLR